MKSAKSLLLAIAIIGVNLMGFVAVEAAIIQARGLIQ